MTRRFATLFEFKNSFYLYSMSETAIGQRLKVLIEALELDVRSFSQRINVAETTTRNYLNRGTKPGTEYLEKLSNSFNEANLHWLLTGKGEPLLAEQGSVTVTTKVSGEKSTVTNIGKSIGGTLNITSLEDCRRDLINTQAELARAQAQLDSYAALLATKDALIAAKDETITLLRASYNRPN
jgi:transcriptional regulator with XRE-family HTH domain